jgi:NADPH:quinone reductase
VRESIATCRAESDKGIASRAGADEVLLTTGNLAERIRTLAPDGIDHVVEVAFGANIKTDTEVLAQGGSIATYATNTPNAGDSGLATRFCERENLFRRK